LDSSIIVSVVQFYNNNHSSKSKCWIKLKIYLEFPRKLFYIGVKFQVNRSLGRPCDINQNRLYEFCYLFSFDLWTLCLAMILFLQGRDSLFWKFSNSIKIFNEMQYNFQGWQRFINVLKFFFHKDSLFILAIQGKKSLWYLMTD